MWWSIVRHTAPVNRSSANGMAVASAHTTSTFVPSSRSSSEEANSGWISTAVSRVTRVSERIGRKTRSGTDLEHVVTKIGAAKNPWNDPALYCFGVFRARTKLKMYLIHGLHLTPRQVLWSTAWNNQAPSARDAVSGSWQRRPA